MKSIQIIKYHQKKSYLINLWQNVWLELACNWVWSWESFQMQITSVNTFKWYSGVHCKLHVVPVQYHKHEFFKPQGILQLNSRFWPKNMYKNVQIIMKQAENWTHPPRDEHIVLRKYWWRIKQLQLVINFSLSDSKLFIKMKNISCHNSVHK